MLTNVILYGHLAQRFGRTFEFELDTIGEAINALSANLPDFRAHLIEHSEPGYRVIVDNQPVMSLEELQLSVVVPRTIRIVPVVRGAGDGKAFGMIFVGIALVAATVLTGGAALGGFLGLSAATGSMIASAGIGLGLSLVMGGISSLLTPTQSIDRAKQSDNSFFSGSESTLSQGERAPIALGRYLLKGRPISVRLVVEQG